MVTVSYAHHDPGISISHVAPSVYGGVDVRVLWNAWKRSCQSPVITCGNKLQHARDSVSQLPGVRYP